MLHMRADTRAANPNHDMSNHFGIPDRRMRWVSSIEERNAAVLSQLQDELVKYYQGFEEYYGATGNGMSTRNWTDAAALGHRRIIEAARSSAQILEIGCGNADIVRCYPELASRYTGVDFSERLLAANRDAVPAARFDKLESPRRLPFAAASFDLVFSTFVIEHAVHPADFLAECARVLRPGGVLIVLCPNFAGTGTISSQRLGYGPEIGSQKWAKGRYWDAVVTAWDARISMRLACAWVRLKNRRRPHFFINTRPTCFTDSFRPDVDAVYVTDEREMRMFLGDWCDFAQNCATLRIYARRTKIIFLEGKRR